MRRWLTASVWLCACFVLAGHGLPSEVRAQSCAWVVSGQLDGLYRGAQQQRLALRCDAHAIALVQHDEITLGGTNLPPLRARVEDIAKTGTSIEIQLSVFGIPAELPERTVEWSLYEKKTGALLGTVTLASRAGLSVAKDDKNHPRIAVSYDDAALNALHSGAAVDGIAVISPGELIPSADEARRPRRDRVVENTTSIEIDAQLVILAQSLRDRARLTQPNCTNTPREAQCASATSICSDMFLEDCTSPADVGQICKRAREECFKDELFVRNTPWRVRAETWLPDVTFGECGDSCGPENAYWSEADARLDTMSTIMFGVRKAHNEALKVAVDLIDPNSNEVYYRTQLTLSDRARSESLPLPVSQLLYVACGKRADNDRYDPALMGAGVAIPGVDVAFNHAMRAVEDSDLEGGQCVLRYDPTLSEDVQVRDFGPQRLLVSVSRAGATSASQRWLIESSTKSASVVLPAISGGASGTGPYEVRAAIDGAELADVAYRPAAANSSATASSATQSLGSLEFSAKLRPRGRSGWRSIPVRTFMTFPVQVFGFRMPARVRELHVSSDSVVIQTTTAKAGVLLAVEPWDYDAGKNPLPVPVRFLTGFHVFDLARGSIAPSYVTGISLTFPILDLPTGTTNNQLGTDVAIGAFWEIDLHQAHPLRDGNHFLLTVGANVLSLFGSK